MRKTGGYDTRNFGHEEHRHHEDEISILSPELPPARSCPLPCHEDETSILSPELLVQAETYLLLCQRYIELNPVRASMVSDPGDYPWSSYRANAFGLANAILTPHPLYLALVADDASRREAYRDLFRAAFDNAPLADLRMALNPDLNFPSSQKFRYPLI
jgi:hypothetical protein